MHLYCALHPVRSIALAYHSASRPGLPGISTIPVPNSCSDKLREVSVYSEAISPRMQFCLCLLFMKKCYSKWGGRGARQPGAWSALQAGAVVQPAPWMPVLAARQGKAPTGAAGTGAGPVVLLQSTQLLLSAMAGPPHPTVLSARSKYFRGKFYFISFMHILKLILTTSVLLLASCPCCVDLVSIKFKEGLFTGLNGAASQLSQPPPHLWLQSAVFQLCVWSCVSVLPDLSSYSTLLLTANGSPF